MITALKRRMARALPPVRRFIERYDALQAERDRLAEEVRLLRSGRPLPDEGSFKQWVWDQIAAEPYWFHKIELEPGRFTPGLSDPRVEKLPYYGLPEDLRGKRVLDIGCAEGFFSFEAERRGASQVMAMDSEPGTVRRFNMARAALDSKADAYLTSVYDLNPRMFGTFDLVLFYGVLYHLRHPQLALEKILSVCTGTLLMQSAIMDDLTLAGAPVARFHAHGMVSGPLGGALDPTVFWIFTPACCRALLEAAGFVGIEEISSSPHPLVLRASSPVQRKGKAPAHEDAPWC